MSASGTAKWIGTSAILCGLAGLLYRLIVTLHYVGRLDFDIISLLMLIFGAVLRQKGTLRSAVIVQFLSAAACVTTIVPGFSILTGMYTLSDGPEMRTQASGGLVVVTFFYDLAMFVWALLQAIKLEPFIRATTKATMREPAAAAAEGHSGASPAPSQSESMAWPAQRGPHLPTPPC